MVTQKDIAESLGVSVTLVSRVLSGKAAEIGASPATAERIRQAAERAGYHPSYHARMLRGAPSRVLGVAVHDFDDPFFGHVLRLLQQHAAIRGFSLMLTSTGNAPFDAFLQQPISRLILLGSSSDSDWLETWANRSVPLVQIGHGPDHPSLTRITVDEEAGFSRLLAHLKERGARRTGYLGPEAGVLGQRYAAYRRMAEAVGLEHRRLVPASGVSMEDGAGALERGLRRQSLSDIDALVCVNDRAAVGALHILSRQGLHVPRDLLVSGFDDIPLARFVRPSLTTLQQPIDDMIARLFPASAEPTPLSIQLPPDLIVRESSAREA